MVAILYGTSCFIALVMLILVIAWIVMVIQAAKRDTVSTAREDWIQRRSDKDEQGW